MNSTSIHKIEDYLLSQKDEMLTFLKEIVSLETPTSKPKSQEKILELLADTFQSIDYSVMIMPGQESGGYLFARPENRRKFSPLQLLVGHCDTVWPINTLESMPIIDSNGKLSGPGVYDMKAGLTQMVFALKTIRDLSLNAQLVPVVLINTDEEKGSKESTEAIKRLAKISNRAFILEPPLGIEGKLKTARKGIGRFTITVTGIPAHAGLDPGKGASAILELSHQVQQLFSLNDPEKGITVNVGMIEGGTNPNVVAPEAKAVIDVRVLTHKDGERITEKINSLTPNNPDTKLKVEGFIGRPPMEKTDRNQLLWLAAKQLGDDLGLDLQEGTAGGGSDGNTTSLYTATLDGLGTTGDGAHARHEFIFSDKLLERTMLLTSLILMKDYGEASK